MLVNVGPLNDYTSSQNDSGPTFTHLNVIINFPCYNIFYDMGPFSSNQLKSIHIDHINMFSSYMHSTIHDVVHAITINIFQNFFFNQNFIDN